MRAESWPALWRLGVLTLIIVLAAGALLLQARLIANLDFDGENTVDEAESLFVLRNAVRGQEIYRDFSTPPHFLTVYMPLVYFLPAAAAKVLGADWLGTLVVGRAYVYACWLGIAWAIFGLARQAGCDRQLAGLSALLWLAGLVAPQNANSFKPDAPALFFSLAAVWMYGRRPERPQLAICVALLLAAFLHKHSAVVALAVILIEESARGRWRSAAAVLAGWAAGVGGTMAVGQMLTEGGFAQNVFGNLAPFGELGRAGQVLGMTLTRGGGVLLTGALACALAPSGRWPRRLKWYWLLALAFAAVTSLKFGSGPNYYLEPMAVGCVLTGVLLQHWSAPCENRVKAWGRFAWMGVLLAFCLQPLAHRAVRGPELVRLLANHGVIRRQQTEQWDQVEATVSAHGTPMLIEDLYLAVRRDKTPWVLNASNFDALRRMRQFDDTELVRSIEMAQFRAIVTIQPAEHTRGFRHFPAHWLEPITSTYTLAARADAPARDTALYIYRPRFRSGDSSDQVK